MSASLTQFLAVVVVHDDALTVLLVIESSGFYFEKLKERLCCGVICLQRSLHL